MDQFPQSFNFSSYEQLLQNKLDSKKKEELAEMRAYVDRQFKISIDEEYPYFVIDFVSQDIHTRETILKEVLERFPTVGYVSDLKEILEKSPMVGYVSDTTKSFGDESKEKFPKTLSVVAYLPYRSDLLIQGRPYWKFINSVNNENFAESLQSDLFVIACTQEFADEMTTYRL
jgi:hypothetical protein